MDRVLLLERVMEGVNSTYKYQLSPTLTLYAPMVVPCTDRVLLSVRVMKEFAYSANICQ